MAAAIHNLRDVYAQIRSQLEKVRETNDACLTARCPAHEDKGPSFSMKIEGDRILVHCFAGCTLEEICTAVGVQQAELFDDYDPNPSGKPRILPFDAARRKPDGIDLAAESADMRRDEVEAKWSADTGEMPGLRKGGKPEGVLATTDNLEIIFRYSPDWKHALQFDAFRDRIEKIGPMPFATELGDWTETDTTRAIGWVCREYEFSRDPSRERVLAAIVSAAMFKTIHPVREYLAGLEWDGTPRLDFWLSDFLGAEQTDYTAAVGRKFLVGSVARVCRPGCQMDTTLVTVGPQGLGKTSAIRVLYGAPWVSHTPLNLGQKDAMLALQGHWCLEQPEMAGYTKKEANTVKAFLSAPVDHFRRPYGRAVEAVPRQNVFWGTSNDASLFHDATGARRYWVVEVAEANLAGLASVRDQLWAEAKHRYDENESWWLDGEVAEAAEVTAEKFREDDPWESLLADQIDRRPGLSRVLSTELYEWLGIEPDKRTTATGRRLTAVMCTRFGWVRPAGKLRCNGRLGRGYVRRVPGFSGTPETTGDAISG